MKRIMKKLKIMALCILTATCSSCLDMLDKTPISQLSVGAQYIFRIAPRHWLDRVQVNANYNAAGRIYWTEENNVSQAFYGTLNGRVSLEKGNGVLAFWIRNALDKEYQAFYFESMGNGFMQKGRPMQLGVDVRCRF